MDNQIDLNNRQEKFSKVCQPYKKLLFLNKSDSYTVLIIPNNIANIILKGFQESYGHAVANKLSSLLFRGIYCEHLSRKPGEIVACDFLRPLPSGRGGIYVFVVIDCFSKYVRLYGMKRAVARTAIDKILNDFNNIISIKCIIADHGTQFMSRFGHFHNTVLM